MRQKAPILLSIAGSDSSGGAGIQADIKTSAALGLHCATAITAITAQNSETVHSLIAMKAHDVRQQMDSVFSAFHVKAVKIGMVPTLEIMHMLTSFFREKPEIIVIYDPVFRASSGITLMDEACQRFLQNADLSWVSCLTPNLDEAAFFLKEGMFNPLNEELSYHLAQIAKKLSLCTRCPSLFLKGGHLEGDALVDCFYSEAGAPLFMQHQRISTRNSRGTGCIISSALAAYLVKGETIEKAAVMAHQYCQNILKASANIDYGERQGPLSH